ncbi:3D domain-containing protein [Paenibacillus sp. BR2-3]|uniref:3D domain-containing protein n=1 Tax=Paenibacillus sp. BR2-3 TaxID=3048494 RepID=UPI0039773846
MKLKFSAFKAITAVLGISVLLHAVPAQAESIHITKEGNTFYKLSKQYGVKLDDLMKANPRVEALNMTTGLKLIIPGKTKVGAAVKAETAKSQVITASLNVEPGANIVEAWGKVFSYDKTLRVKATAYSSAASENGKWGAVDYFGNPLKLGTIAVDPNVIPLGTKVLVTGHSHPGLPKLAFLATATDKGSAIKGNKIDIFIPGSQSFVSEFGFQSVELYVIQ